MYIGPIYGLNQVEYLEQSVSRLNILTGIEIVLAKTQQLYT